MTKTGITSPNYGSRIFYGDVFRGTYVTYGLEADGIIPMMCDLEVRTLEDSDVKTYRAHRLAQFAQNKRVPGLPHTAIKDELMIILGPDVSARLAVERLEALVENIKSKGLVIGQESEGGDIQVEDYVTGEIQ